MNVEPGNLAKQISKLSMKFDRLKQTIDANVDGNARKSLYNAMFSARRAVADVVDDLMGELEMLLKANQACREAADVAILHAQNSDHKVSMITRGGGSN